MADRQRSEWIRRVQPKLRMIANGSAEVNAIRAEHAAAVAVSQEVAESVAPVRTQESPARPGSKRIAKAPKLRKLAADVSASVFVQLKDDVHEASRFDLGQPGITARKGNTVTAEVPVRELVARTPGSRIPLGEDPAVAFVELGQPLREPTPLVADPKPDPPSVSERRFGPAATGSKPEVLIGLIDVGGFDFGHSDFVRDGHTRFEAIWDQGLDDPTRRPDGFDYGAELTHGQLDSAVKAALDGGLPAHELEPQSQRSIGSHATHVASIAAGNRGVCRNAAIAGVLISIPDDDMDRRRSFYDSTRVAHAVDYLLDLADRLKLPVSINISLGTNGHAHDDSSAVGRWIDAALTRPGRSVCVAAGNAGQERPEHAEDMGFVFGRVHAAGQIAARELVSDIEWQVVGNGIADLSENELEVWYGPQDRFGVQVKPPGEAWTKLVEPGRFIENHELPDHSFVSVYNELYHPSNGCNYIAVYVSPRLRADPPVGARAGQWLVRLVGLDIRDGRYDCWIERDDPRRVGRIGDREAWVFPSFFSERSFVDRSTISSLACGQRVIAVANLDEAKREVSITSSQGPTRDGRQKPDIAAPGTDIVAAKGFAPGEDQWVSMSGTSMASPYVAGVVGLMLTANPQLTGAQLGGIIKRAARPLPGADFSWSDAAGSGAIDPRRCIEEAAAMTGPREVA